MEYFGCINWHNLSLGSNHHHSPYQICFSFTGHVFLLERWIMEYKYSICLMFKDIKRVKNKRLFTYWHL